MCIKPLVLPDRVVKCNQCIECLVQRSQEWAFRVEYESKSAITGVFLTLTYAEEHVPLVDTEKGETLTSVDKTELQKFWKRLRERDKKYNWPFPKRPKIRYFACGEYGELEGRAHFHAIVFNLHKQTILKEIEKSWPQGWVKVGTVTPKSIRYVTNYMLLKHKENQPEQGKPFTTMSRKPAIGADYLKHNYYTHNIQFNPKLQNPSHNKRSLPRYYVSKMSEKAQEQIKTQKIAIFEQYLEDLHKEAEKLSPLDPKGHILKEKLHRADIRKKRQKSKL